MVIQVTLLHKTHSALQLRHSCVCPGTVPRKHFFHLHVEFPGDKDPKGHFLRSVPPSAHSSVNQSEGIDTVSHL